MTMRLSHALTIFCSEHACCYFVISNVNLMNSICFSKNKYRISDINVFVWITVLYYHCSSQKHSN